ncbi:gliding motility-associated C-terminal domain-containing protein [Chitinophaga sp.]|uniref:T9SS type B sorting domain-containing protein n=1 Tax=Chitinophaga sp. TaxID=1869181 RepID=UPI0031CDE693
MAISLRLFVISAFLICCALTTRAEGSKELAANGGHRAFWRSSLTSTAQFPYPYLGVIKVYANAGERIYLGSSAQGITGLGGATGTINWRAPNGATGSTGNDPSIGLIANRAEELAGPRLTTNGAAPGYNPYIITVGAGQAGIWEITFMPTNTTVAGGTAPMIPAGDNWTQNPNSWYIAAFDVSVRNAGNTAFVPGRAYLNMFAGITSSVAANFGSFNGIFHILTKDGYQYTFNGNGMQGVAFDFFVNNKGFLDASGNAHYQSVVGIGTSPGTIPVHNPTTPDDATNVTHKLFFNSPATDLPVSAAAPGGTADWLLTTPVASSLSNFSFTGAEGTANSAGSPPLGGSFSFTATHTGSYVISLDVDKNGSFTDVRDRQITGSATVGVNTVAWDGLDGEGVVVPGGAVFPPGAIRVEMLGGEVHFPLLDVERNPTGIIVTRVNGAGAPDDVLYWDDTDIPDVTPSTSNSNPKRNLSGQSSAANGHKWSDNFGNDNGMDSWAYIPSAPLTNTTAIEIKTADLEVVSITPTPASFCVGTQVTYTVTVRNNGPSAVTNAPFVFSYPAELTGVTVTHSTSDTMLVTSETNVPGQYSAMITTGNTGQMIFTITGTASSLPAGGNLLTSASIMRTADVTDPDATNPDAAPPTGPQAECDAAPSGPGCNNIKTNSVTVSTAITNNTISAAQTICTGATPNALTGSVPGGGNGTFTYVWESSTTSATDGFAPAAGANNGQNYTPAALTATTWFRRTVTSGCISSSAAIEITAELVVPPVATAAQPTCAIPTGTITVATMAGLTYSINGTDYQADGVFSNVTPGTYQVTARSSAGCTSAATQIIINPQPATPTAPAVTATQPTCAIATGSITVTAVAGLTYSINGTDYQTGNTFNNVAAGAYQVTARNADGCTSPPAEVTINAQPAQPAAPGVTNVTYCQNDAAAALTATGTQIKWYAAASGGTALPQPVIPVTTTAGATTYWASQTSAEGCESPRAALTVTVFAKPALQITSSTEQMLVTDPRRELSANVPGGTFSGPGVVTENNMFYFNPAAAGVGAHSVSYSYTSGGNCTVTATVSIRVMPEEVDLIVSIQPETRPVGVGDPFTYTITLGNNGPGTATNVLVTAPLPPTVEYISLNTGTGTATQNPGSNTVTWNVGTLPPNEIKTLVITVRPTQLGTLESTASVTSSQTDLVPGNNTANASKEIVGLKIPNVITPNGDGYNDRFVIKGIELFRQNRLTIINRWGNHVYEQQNYANTWDGNGLLEGTYFYILELTDAQGRKHNYKGYLMLAR